jgi:subtilisin family serine protease
MLSGLVAGRICCALWCLLGAVHPLASPTAGQANGAFVRAAERPELRAIDAPPAWRLARGAGVTVGVLDTGVSTDAPDLAGSVTYGPDFTRGINPAGYQPPNLHGTFIASLVAGHGSGPGDAGGVVGVAPAAKVLSVRVLPDDSEPGFRLYNSSPRFDGAVADGIRYAVRHGATVINMSLGSPEPTRDTLAAIGYAVSHGVVVVAAAGNSGAPRHGYSPYSYPAAYTGVISVAALTARGSRASFSERNSSVVIGAPGVNIVGDGPQATYLRASGTSPASAFVAGVAALIRSAYPHLSPAMVTQALVSSTRDQPSAGYSPATGFGEVDAVAALRAAGTLARTHPDTGLATASRFGRAALGPIPVVHRDSPRIAAFTAAAVVAGAAFVVCVAVLSRLTRRTFRARHERSAAAPVVGAPMGGAAPPASMAGHSAPPAEHSAPPPWSTDHAVRNRNVTEETGL